MADWSPVHLREIQWRIKLFETLSLKVIERVGVRHRHEDDTKVGVHPGRELCFIDSRLAIRVGQDRTEASAQRGELVLPVEVHGGHASPKSVRGGRAALPSRSGESCVDESRSDLVVKAHRQVTGTGIIDPPAIHPWRTQTGTGRRQDVAERYRP